MKINLSINETSPAMDFERIATELMNDWVVQINLKRYRIAEVEFYFKSDKHLDPYSHEHPLQKEMGKWYFHGSGIDITFGNNNYHGGILLRAIYDIEMKRFIYGPLNTVAEIFSNFSSVFDGAFVFKLSPAIANEFEKEEVINAPRVGLNSNLDEIYHKKHYRFLIMPKEKHANKGEIAEALRSSKSLDEINKIFGYKILND
jgi:3-methyladenine DNA glycosylase Mpg